MKAVATLSLIAALMALSIAPVMGQEAASKNGPARKKVASASVKSSPAGKPSRDKAMVGKEALSPKGQLVAFLRIPDSGEAELWVRHTRNNQNTLLRRGWLGIPTNQIRTVRIGWEGKRIRLESSGMVRYFDLRGRMVD